MTIGYPLFSNYLKNLLNYSKWPNSYIPSLYSLSYFCSKSNQMVPVPIRPTIVDVCNYFKNEFFELQPQFLLMGLQRVRRQCSTMSRRKCVADLLCQLYAKTQNDAESNDNAMTNIISWRDIHAISIIN